MGYKLMEQVLDLAPVMDAAGWRVLVFLASYANEDTGELWAANATVAKRMGVAERSVKRIRGQLIREGVLVPDGSRRVEINGRSRTIRVYGLDLTALQHKRAAASESGASSVPTSEDDDDDDPAESGTTPAPTFESAASENGHSSVPLLSAKTGANSGTPDSQSGCSSGSKVGTVLAESGTSSVPLYLEVPREYREKGETIQGATLDTLCQPHRNISFRGWLAENGSRAPAILHTVAALVRRKDEDVRALTRMEPRYLEFALARFWQLWEPLTMPTHPCWPRRFADFVRRGADVTYRLSCGAYLWTPEGEAAFAGFEG
ncbi:helix-turn-helix domain-containing protein [Cupriavidus sp. SS-3]|uniref:helix-turn-helix domain-containing protein n=1 Tax=Cupriavidus sp. SS-3 TaxID=3109596 RepID=UPI002DBCC1B4|nr:helix-turn-helix domain-containing protein [Cupriavidus sp. SS-3]MEC3769052.1 helix-turn-helix domain-containing protein [Cupriavidus sp. SS-3]